MVLAVTYHDPGNTFSWELLRAVIGMRPGSGVDRVHIQCSKAMGDSREGRLAHEFLRFFIGDVGRMGNLLLSLDIDDPPLWEVRRRNFGVDTDFQQMVENLFKFGGGVGADGVLYIDGDTWAMTMSNHPHVFESWLAALRGVTKNERVGVVHLQRGEWAMSTYPVWQRETELVMGKLFRKYLGTDPDVASGVFWLKKSVAEGWGKYLLEAQQPTNTQDHPIYIALGLGLEVVGLEGGDRLGAYESRWAATPRDQRPKPEDWERWEDSCTSSNHEDGEGRRRWKERLGLTSRWLGNAGAHLKLIKGEETRGEEMLALARRFDAAVGEHDPSVKGLELIGDIRRGLGIREGAGGSGERGGRSLEAGP